MAAYKQFTVGPLSNDANGVCEDQTTAGAATLSLNGALVSGGVATMAAAQIISIESTGNLSGVTFTVTGTDADDTTISEAVTGPNNSTVVTTAYFKTVTSITVDAAVGTNVEIGPLATNGAVSRSYVLNYRQSPFNLSLFWNLTAGTTTVTVQHTEDDPEGTYTNSFATDAAWRSTTDLTSISADGEGNIVVPVRAVRLLISAADTSSAGKFTVIQGQN